jgi:hypothetical protein
VALGIPALALLSAGHPDQDRPRPQLDAAAPSAWAELSTADAGRLGVGGGRRRTDFVAAGVL